MNISESEMLKLIELRQQYIVVQRQQIKLLSAAIERRKAYLIFDEIDDELE